MQWSEFLKILLEKFNIRQTFKKDAKTQKSRVYNIVEMAQNIYTWQYNRPGLTETESFTSLHLRKIRAHISTECSMRSNVRSIVWLMISREKV
jgi:hypothetical protein